MKVIIGFLLGLGTAWAALAIWQRLPEFPDVDYDHTKNPEEWIAMEPDMLQSLTEERPEVLQRMKYPPPPFIDPYVHVTRHPYQP